MALLGCQQTGAFGLLTLAVSSGVGLLRLAVLLGLLVVEEVLCARGRTIRGCKLTLRVLSPRALRLLLVAPEVHDLQQVHLRQEARLVLEALSTALRVPQLVLQVLLLLLEPLLLRQQPVNVRINFRVVLLARWRCLPG